MAKPILIALLLTAWAAGARAADGDEPRPARDCPQLLGDRQDRADNRARRERLLEHVERAQGAVDITHSARAWHEPVLLELSGVRVDRTELPEDAGESRRAAVLALDDEARHLGCELGTYRVRRDAALGRDARVLAVLKEGVLLEVHGRLAFVAVDDADPPLWRMIWKSPWKVRKPTRYVTSAPASRRGGSKRGRRKGKR